MIFLYLVNPLHVFFFVMQFLNSSINLEAKSNLRNLGNLGPAIHKVSNVREPTKFERNCQVSINHLLIDEPL